MGGVEREHVIRVGVVDETVAVGMRIVPPIQGEEKILGGCVTWGFTPGYHITPLQGWGWMRDGGGVGLARVVSAHAGE